MGEIFSALVFRRPQFHEMGTKPQFCFSRCFNMEQFVKMAVCSIKALCNVFTRHFTCNLLSYGCGHVHTIRATGTDQNQFKSHRSALVQTI